jgi:hypothetical protein
VAQTRHRSAALFVLCGVEFRRRDYTISQDREQQSRRHVDMDEFVAWADGSVPWMQRQYLDKGWWLKEFKRETQCNYCIAGTVQVLRSVMRKDGNSQQRSITWKGGSINGGGVSMGRK